MTNKYNLEIIETNTHLRVTYSNNKFKKLEHLKGVISKKTMLRIGVIIPSTEDSIDDFKTIHQGRISYTLILKEKSLYGQFNSEWFSFYTRNYDRVPKFTGTDGKALKEIITYLTSASGSEQEALELWTVILGKWEKLSEFHKANCDLKYINSKLNILLNAIKQANDNTSESIFKSAMESEVGNNFEFK